MKKTSENLIFDRSLFQKILLTKLHISSFEQLNKAKFADKIGIPHNTLKKTISGDIKNPSINTILAMAKSLGCSIDELVGHQPNTLEVKKLLSSDFIVDQKLFLSVISQIFFYLEKNKISVNFKQLIFSIDNIYDYSSRRNLTTPDLHFLEWVLSKISR